jgi:GNAT superfamily N-acetyltransferase
MINTDELQFTKLSFEQVTLLVKWAEKEGWNPGRNDAHVFWNTDPDGFYGYFYQDELVAGGSIVSYDGVFGFMGFFMVKEEYRALGIGSKLWYQRRDTLLARLNNGASIGMDGVVAMQPFYKKGGFEIAFRDERHERVGAPYEIDSRITNIQTGDLPEILAYDVQCFGFKRGNFLQAWIQQYNAQAFKLLENGQLKGYAVIRKAAAGYKIGPLFANNVDVAEELYKACLNAAVDEPVFIDIPVANANAVALTKKYGTSYVFECARMYYGKPPSYDIGKVFGITSFELG